MEIVKICNEKYMKPSDLKNEIKYATNIKKTDGFIGGLGVTPYNPEEMIYQMNMVKRSFRKNEFGRRQLRHIIVSFEQEWSVSPKLALTIAYDIALFYADRFQIAFGVHQDTENTHIHFVQNTVSHIDGKMFSGAWQELESFKIHVHSVLEKYIPECKNECSLSDFLQDEW